MKSLVLLFAMLFGTLTAQATDTMLCSGILLDTAGTPIKASSTEIYNYEDDLQFSLDGYQVQVAKVDIQGLEFLQLTIQVFTVATSALFPVDAEVPVLLINNGQGTFNVQCVKQQVVPPTTAPATGA